MYITMSGTIPSIQIQKLCHQLEEIRIRALDSILSKLENGFVNEKDITGQKELILKLFDWFDFENHSEDGKVLNLILRLVKADKCGSLHTYIKAKGLLDVLPEIRNKVSQDLTSVVDEIGAAVRGSPALDHDSRSSLSQRSEIGEQRGSAKRSVGTTASPIEIHVTDGNTEALLQSQAEDAAHQYCHGYFSDGVSKPESVVAYETRPTVLYQHGCFQCLVLPWQSLVAADHQVFSSVEKSLANEDLNTVLQTCSFFTDVMLQDFPAEVFLQRPAIFKRFIELLDSNKKAREPATYCLYRLTAALCIRISYYSDPSIANLKQESFGRASPGMSTPSMASVHSAESHRTEEASSPKAATASPQASGFNAYQQNVTDDTDYSNETTEDSVLLKLQQLSLPQYCLLCLFHIIPHMGPSMKTMKLSLVNHISLLAKELIKLLVITVRTTIWHSSDPVTDEVKDHFKQVLAATGEVLEKHRKSETYDEANRLAYLQMLAITHKLIEALVPCDVCDRVIPPNLKHALCNSLLELTMIPSAFHLYIQIAGLIQAFKRPADMDFRKRYEETISVCKSMKAAVKFIKNHDKLGKDTFSVLNEALLSLPYHSNLSVVQLAVEIAVRKLPQLSLDKENRDVITRVIVKLLAHAEVNIKQEMYACCHKYVVAILGVEQAPRLSLTDSRQLAFLCNTSVLIEIICHGASSSDNKIQQHAEEILIHLLKGKYLLPEEIWCQFLECLVPALPLLQCYADKTTALGRAVAKMFDPDISSSIHLLKAEVLKGNLRLLFCNDPLTREEAVSRITWLMSREEKAQEKLPNFSSLRGLLLNSICLVDRPVDLSGNRSQQHFYEVSSLYDVMELLTSQHLEPALRRSVLTQISVMLGDSYLHKIFLERNGLKIILSILQKSLLEKEFRNYPDSVIPCISILKSVVQYSPKLRHELSQQEDIYSCIVRAMYLYNGDERLRPDASLLLALLLYSDYILSVPEPRSNGVPWHRISLPELIARRMTLPFVCHTHWHTSHYAEASAKRILLKKENGVSLLRFIWNAEWFGSLEEILKWPAIPPNTLVSEKELEFSSELRLTDEELHCLKVTAIASRSKQHLYDIQNATTHRAVFTAVDFLTGYIILHMFLSEKEKWKQSMAPTDIFEVPSLAHTDCWCLDLPWEETFTRFLTIPPGSREDKRLLLSLLQFLSLYIKMDCSLDQVQQKHLHWIADILKDQSHPLPSLLQRITDTLGSDDVTSAGVYKELFRELLSLIKECILKDRKTLVPETPCVQSSSEGTSFKSASWSHIIRSIIENLTFSDTQHFYDLAMLEWMLSCLCYLTSFPGWSTASDIQKLWDELIYCLAELVVAFHCGKGGKSMASFMGLSITRSSMLCMNHVLSEMQSNTEKNWESIWLCALGAERSSTGEANLTWLPPLWLSRDPIIRSAALQLIAGFCLTQKSCKLLLKGLTSITGGIWGVALSFLVEQEEASIVKEQAANLLTNLSSHSASSGNAVPSLCHPPVVATEEIATTGVQALLLLLDECHFYEEVAHLLSGLYLGDKVYPGKIKREKGWTLDSLSGCTTSPETEFGPQQYMLVYDGNTRNDHPHEAGSPAMTESLCAGSVQMEQQMIATPALIKTVCWFINNLMTLNSFEAIQKINKHNLVLLLFRCLTFGVPPEDFISHPDNKKCLLYGDILEMYTSVCHILTRSISSDDLCHSTLLHIHDSIHLLLALLEKKHYSIKFPQLISLRNQLWSELFKLLSALLLARSGFEVLRDALFHCGHGPFFTTMKMAIEDNMSHDLRYSAITALTLLLSYEDILHTESYSTPATAPKSLRDLFDESSSEEKNYIEAHSVFQSEKVENAIDSEKENMQPEKQIPHVSHSPESLLCGRSVGSSNKNILRTAEKDVVRFSPRIGDCSLTPREVPGGILCRTLVQLHELYNLHQGCSEDSNKSKDKALVVTAIASLLAVSRHAKEEALRCGLLQMLIVHLRELHIKLSLESTESLRRTSDKKRISPVIKDIGVLFGVMTNFMNGDTNVKMAAAESGLADLVHKLWIWCCAVPGLLQDALKMLSTFSKHCISASQSLVLTSTVPGVGLRRTPSTMSLLHAIIDLVHKEMEQVNRIHDADILCLAFLVLKNACQSLECRNVICKGNLFHSFSMLHPDNTKRQKHWEPVERIWLEFLADFTYYAEGQLLLPKVKDALDIIIQLALSKHANKMAALNVLRNISFHQQNRPRLLGSDQYLQVLHHMLQGGSFEEKVIIASMIWALVANNQKGKLVIKCSGLDSKLQDVLSQLHAAYQEGNINYVDKAEMFAYVLRILHADNATAGKK